MSEVPILTKKTRKMARRMPSRIWPVVSTYAWSKRSKYWKMYFILESQQSASP